MIPCADDSDTSGYLPAPSLGWRDYCCNMLPKGEGIELGALHRPMKMAPHCKIVDYVDNRTLEELREHYPEFNELDLIPPTIVDDAQTLGKIRTDSYDFLIASHLIEHMPSPLTAIENWLRVVKRGGSVYIVCPDKREIFDCRRPRTSLAHIVNDYQIFSEIRRTLDWTHFLEYAELVDNYIHFQGELLPHEIVLHAKNLVAREYSIHYHTFLPIDFENMLRWFHQYVMPIEVQLYPAMSKGDSEFHVIIRKP